MIGTVECRVTAHRPNQPLSPIFTYVGSPSNMRIIDVPKGIGQFKVDVVKVVVDYPNNKKEIVEAVRQGSVYVATIPSCEIAGKTTGGVEIICDCTDENGNPVGGFVIGKGDVFVLERDSKFSKLVEKSYVKYVDELPTTPAKGDIVYHNGSLQMFVGDEWLKFSDQEVIDNIVERLDNLDAEVEVLNENMPTKVSDLENDVGYITQDEVDATKITSADGNQYINGEGEVYVKGGIDYTPWETKYVVYGTTVDEITLLHFGDPDDGYWIASYRGVSIQTDPLRIPGTSSALQLNFRWKDDGQWYDMVSTREQIEVEWSKKGDLALTADISEIDSKATNALSIANNLYEDIHGIEGINWKIDGLEQTKASKEETDEIKSTIENHAMYISELQQDKITNPTSGMEKGKILTVVEVDDVPTSRNASLQSASPRATTHLEWAAVKPDVTMAEVDDKINQFAAHYLTKKDADGKFVQFATHADLARAKQALIDDPTTPQFWYGDDAHVPDKNDYLVVLDDEDHEHKTTRYSYVGDWPAGYFRYQYTINQTSFSQEQWDVINGTSDAYAKSEDIPTKTSDLTNDSNFVNQTTLDTEVGKAKYVNGQMWYVGGSEPNEYQIAGPSGEFLTISQMVEAYRNGGFRLTFGAPEMYGDGIWDVANYSTTYPQFITFQNISKDEATGDYIVGLMKITAVPDSTTRLYRDAGAVRVASKSDIPTNTKELVDEDETTRVVIKGGRTIIQKYVSSGWYGKALVGTTETNDYYIGKVNVEETEAFYILSGLMQKADNTIPPMKWIMDNVTKDTNQIVTDFDYDGKIVRVRCVKITTPMWIDYGRFPTDEDKYLGNETVATKEYVDAAIGQVLTQEEF